MFTEPPRGIRLPDRLANDLKRLDVLTPDVDEGGARLDRHTRDHDSFEHHVRVAFHYLPILKGSRLALVRVDGEVARPAVIRRHERPFEPSTEAGSATAAKSRIAHERDEFFRRHLSRPDDGLVTTRSFVFVERKPPLAVGREQ